MKNKFYHEIQAAYANNASKEQLKLILGRSRAKRGMFEGDLSEGELEIGQISSLINDIKPAALIIKDIMTEFHESISFLQKLDK
jgi:enoyl-[acyl-carrier protein] reductase II